MLKNIPFNFFKSIPFESKIISNSEWTDLCIILCYVLFWSWDNISFIRIWLKTKLDEIVENRKEGNLKKNFFFRKLKYLMKID